MDSLLSGLRRTRNDTISLRPRVRVEGTGNGTKKFDALMVGTIKKTRELVDGNNERAGRVRCLRPDTASFIARNPYKNVYEKPVVFPPSLPWAAGIDVLIARDVDSTVQHKM